MLRFIYHMGLAGKPAAVPESSPHIKLSWVGLEDNDRSDTPVIADSNYIYKRTPHVHSPCNRRLEGFLSNPIPWGRCLKDLSSQEFFQSRFLGSVSEGFEFTGVLSMRIPGIGL